LVNLTHVVLRVRSNLARLGAEQIDACLLNFNFASGLKFTKAHGVKFNDRRAIQSCKIYNDQIKFDKDGAKINRQNS